MKAAVLRSQGTQFLGMTIWNELNIGWSQFGDTPVQIDYRSLAGYGWTVDDIAATGADVLILSCPGYLDYWAEEVSAVRHYVQDGHGLIITYGSFLSADRALAPLVGLSESIRLGTGTVRDPVEIDLVDPSHPLFAQIQAPYLTGSRFSALPLPDRIWRYNGGVMVGRLFPWFAPAQAGIVALDTPDHRGLYFSYYIENKAGGDGGSGSNEQDMQVFYNSLLWAAAPEPATLLMAFAGGVWLLARRRR